MGLDPGPALTSMQTPHRVAEPIVILPRQQSSITRLILADMDTDIGTELFAGYENDFKLIVADISSKLQALQDQDGEAKKSSIRAAERAVEEAEEIVRNPDRPAITACTDAVVVDRSNGDGSDEHTQSTAIKSLRSSPGPYSNSREVKTVSGSPPLARACG